MMRITAIVLGLVVYAQAMAQEEPAVDENLDVIDWRAAEERMTMLSKAGFHPFLLPVIMSNRDTIELTPDQIRRFKSWRSKNRIPMIHAMDQIIQESIRFQTLSLNPETSEETLYQKLQDIFELHKKVLGYQLACRRNIVETFTEEQWDNFRFVLTENGFTLE